MLSPDTSRRPCRDAPHLVSSQPSSPRQQELAKAMPVICHPQDREGFGKSSERVNRASIKQTPKLLPDLPCAAN